MGVRFDTTGNGFKLTAALPPSQNVSVCCWARSTAISNGDVQPAVALMDSATSFANSALLSILGNSGTAGRAGFFSNAGGIQSIGAASSVPCGTATAPWIFLAYSQLGTVVKGYWKFPGGGLVQSANLTGDTFTPAALGIGWDDGGGDVFAGMIAGVRIWTATLTSEDFEQESRSVRAFRRADAWDEFPMDLDTDLIGRAGAQRKLVATNAVDVFPGWSPPVPYWPQRAQVSVFVPASGFALEEAGAPALLFAEPSPILPAAMRENLASSASATGLEEYADGAKLFFVETAPPMITFAHESAPPTSFLDEAPPPPFLFATEPTLQPRNVAEDPAPTAFLDEAGALTWIGAADTVPFAASQLEEFYGLLTIDDAPGPTAWTVPLEIPFQTLPPQPEDFQGFFTIDDAPGPTAWLAPSELSFLVAAPQPEDFQGFLTVDDAPGPTAWVVPPEVSFLTPSPQPEDFQGFLTIDDSAGATAWRVAEPAAVLPLALPEDFTATTAGLEDGGATTLVLEPPTWLAAPQVAEDVASATAPFDESFPTWVAPEVFPWRTPSIHEDFVPTTVTGFDEQAAAVWQAPEPPPWVLVATNPEDLARAAAPFEENGSAAWSPTDAPVWLSPTVSEDFAPPTWLDESAPPRVTWADAPVVLPSVASEEMAPLTWLDESAAPALVTAAVDTPPLGQTSEDFAPSAALVEDAGAAWVAAESPTARAQNAAEDFTATQPLEETPGLVWRAPDAPPWVVACVAPEDLASTPSPLGLEEGAPPPWQPSDHGRWVTVLALYAPEDWTPILGQPLVTGPSVQYALVTGPSVQYALVTGPSVQEPLVTE